MKLINIIKEVAKFGSGLAIGFTAGKSAGYAERGRESYEEDIWTGPTSTLTYPKEEAEELRDRLTLYINYDWPFDGSESITSNTDEDKEWHPKDNNVFWESDIRKLRTEVSHELASITEGDEIEVEMTGRQRLMMYDLISGGPSTVTMDPEELREYIGKTELGA